MPVSTKEQRFTEFLARLLSAPPANTGAEALILIERILTEVEDELSAIPNNPINHQADGRLYPPREDSAREVPGRSDLIRYRSRGHNTFIRNNGAIEIHDLDGVVVFSKRGADAKGVEYRENPDQ